MVRCDRRLKRRQVIAACVGMLWVAVAVDAQRPARPRGIGAGDGQRPAPSATDSSTWNESTQEERNSAIVAAARKQITVAPSCSESAQSCKIWVQQLILKVSGVKVPKNDSTQEYPWSWDLTTGDYTRIKTNSTGSAADKANPSAVFTPGRIIQMTYTNRDGSKANPHTAIIGSVDSAKMTWIDANMDGHGTVQEHDETFEDFFDVHVKNAKYTVYEIQ